MNSHPLLFLWGSLKTFHLIHFVLLLCQTFFLTRFLIDLNSTPSPWPKHLPLICKGFVKKPLSEVFVCNVYNPLRFNLLNPKNSSDKNKIQFSCVKYWNSIPSHIREASTLNSFNNKHKLYLLSSLAPNQNH